MPEVEFRCMGAEGGVSVAGSWSSWAQLPLERFLIVNRIFRVGDVSLTRNDQTELYSNLIVPIFSEMEWDGSPTWTCHQVRRLTFSAHVDF